MDKATTIIVVVKGLMLITRPPNATFATYVHYNGPELTIDPCTLTHTTDSANYGPPTFNNTIKAFDLAHRLGVEPSCEMIRTLDHVVSTVSASHDQPEPGPSSLGKRPHLEERLTTVKEDTISLGDDDDDPVNWEITLMILMVMMMQNMSMASCIALRKMTTKSARQPLQLLRKSLDKLLFVLHLPMCLHWHQEHLHRQEICPLQHHSTLAELNTTRMGSVLWLIHLPAPNMNVECLCTLVTCMVSSNTPLSNFGISKVPLVDNKLWVRPVGARH